MSRNANNNNLKEAKKAKELSINKCHKLGEII